MKQKLGLGLVFGALALAAGGGWLLRRSKALTTPLHPGETLSGGGASTNVRSGSCVREVGEPSERDPLCLMNNDRTGHPEFLSGSEERLVDGPRAKIHVRTRDSVVMGVRGRLATTNACYGWELAAFGGVSVNVVRTDPANGVPICRAFHGAGIHPGKVVGPGCNIAYGSQEIVIDAYHTLAGPPVTWVSVNGGSIPSGAMTGGWENGAALVICRASHSGVWHAGKVISGSCNFGLGGRNIVTSTFDVMMPGSCQETTHRTAASNQAYSWQAGAVDPSDPNAVRTDPSLGFVVCRAPHGTGVHPGKQFAGACNIAYGAQEVVVTDGFETLVGPQGRWQTVQHGQRPEGAFVAGNENGQPLVLCRVLHGGTWSAGKVIGNECNFGFGGRNVGASTFDVLIP
jgi:hypothetical protein